MTLEKAFHIADVDERALYDSRFSATESVHLGIEVSGHPAFFLMTQGVYESLLKVAAADKKILRLTQELPSRAIEQFALKNLVDEIVVTNEIEGVSSTRREVHDVIESLERRDTRGRFRGLVNKYLMLTRNDGTPILTPKDIRLAYDELVLEEVIADNPKNAPDGELFRADSVSVYTSTQKRIHDGLLPESRIREALERSLEFLNGNAAPPLPRIAAFHFMFGYIHPFYDGNGRTNRYISSYYLSNSYEPVVGYGLSFAIKKRIGEYYRGFSICEGALGMGDITPFVLMFCNIVVDAVERIAKALETGRDSFLAYVSIISADAWLASDRNRFAAMDNLIQAALFSDYGMKMDEIAIAMQMSKRNAQRYVALLDSAGLVEKRKVGKSVFYRANLNEVDKLADKPAARCRS